jgi:ribonuclease P protein component
MRNTLSRSESLKSYKLIRLLFQKGDSFFSYPYRIFYLEQEKEHNVPVQFLISVSKKKIKTAVKRIRIKRLFRESYRTNKHELLEMMKKRDKNLAIAFVFVGDQNMEFSQIEEKTKIALQQSIKTISE